METYLTADKMVNTYCRYDSIEEMDKEKIPYLKGISRAVGELTLISAPPKAGKTMLMLQLALCMATGNKWLGFKPRPKYSDPTDEEMPPNYVMYVNLETNEELLSYHLQAMCKAMGMEKPPTNLIFINLNEYTQDKVRKGIDDYILYRYGKYKESDEDDSHF